MLFSCKSDIEVINTITSKNEFPSIASKNIEIIYSDTAKIQIKAISPELNRFLEIEEPYTEFPKGITVFFYNPDQKIESKIVANYAIFYESQDLWEVKNNVIATNNKGEILNTEQLFWNQKERLVYSNKFVKITTENQILFGEGFESNQNFSEWKIKKLKGTIFLKDEK